MNMHIFYYYNNPSIIPVLIFITVNKTRSRMFTGVERSPRLHIFIGHYKLVINITTMSPIEDLLNGIYVSWICFMSVVR